MWSLILFAPDQYVEKALIIRNAPLRGDFSPTTSIWHAVKTHNLREVYRLIVTSDTNIINTTFNDVFGIDSYHHVVEACDIEPNSHEVQRKEYDPSACQRIKDSNEPGNCLQGCSLLHLACHCGNPVMVELLLQFGADINMRDFHGRTPLHHCISSRNNIFSKLLLRR